MTLAAGALVGALFATGLLLAWAGLPGRRALDLAARLDPYVVPTVTTPRRATYRRPATVGAGPALPARLGRLVGSALGGDEGVRRRLVRAGRPGDVAAFRTRQAWWLLTGAGLGTLLSAVGWLLGRGPATSVPVLAGTGAIAGVLLADAELTRAARAREGRLLDEFPTLAELLALAVGAGEGAVGALARVARLCRGDLSAEFERCLADARAGASLPAALEHLAERTDLPTLRRFADGVAVALERGTPLADVLRAQADDVREEGLRAVMETAGRREILMMIPVVFVVLPTTVAFAVFPGLHLLDLSW